MKPDYYADLGQKQYTNGFQGIDYDDVNKVTTHYYTLVATGDKKDRDTGANAFRTEWVKKRLKVGLRALPEFLQPPVIDLSQLPFGSFYIQFQFKLSKPYISRDDNPFYIVDNPIVREKVFRYPMVRATAWKGSLRHALWQIGDDEDNEQDNEQYNEQIRRLFGLANDNDDTGNDGRLYFYSTFFTQTSLEVINPHNREKRIGKKPILMECVPSGATGTFTLLYTPLDCIGKSEDKEKAETCRQVFKDLKLVAQGLEAMFTVYGFGAKTSSGFGVAEDAVRAGEIVVGGFAYESTPLVDETTQTAPPEPDLPRYLSAPNQLAPEFVSKEGGLQSEDAYRRFIEEQGQKYTKKNRQLYSKAKKWWEREGQQLAEQQEEPESEPEPVVEMTPAYPLASESFATFEALPQAAQKLADALGQMEGDV